MAMQEVVCAGCGAINHTDAHACWRCLETLTDARMGYETSTEPDLQSRPATA